jgi:hypothetical protein
VWSHIDRILSFIAYWLLVNIHSSSLSLPLILPFICSLLCADPPGCCPPDAPAGFGQTEHNASQPRFLWYDLKAACHSLSRRRASRQNGYLKYNAADLPGTSLPAF